MIDPQNCKVTALVAPSNHCLVGPWFDIHWLPLATIDLVDDDNRHTLNLKFRRSYFELLYLLWMVDSLGCQNIKGPSLCVLGYHWLPLATNDLVGDNRKFEV